MAGDHVYSKCSQFFYRFDHRWQFIWYHYSGLWQYTSWTIRIQLIKKIVYIFKCELISVESYASNLVTLPLNLKQKQSFQSKNIPGRIFEFWKENIYLAQIVNPGLNRWFRTDRHQTFHSVQHFYSCSELSICPKYILI